MNLTLNKNDYIKILKYYNLDIPKSSILIKNKAEDIISQKLCSCIKKVEPTNEQKSIGICSRTVINRKGLKRGSFSCKKKRKIQLMKRSKTLKLKSKK
jgi:hypothetical protein